MLRQYEQLCSGRVCGRVGVQNGSIEFKERERDTERDREKPRTSFV